MAGQRLRNHVDLVGHPFRCQPGAGSGEDGRVFVQQRTGQGSGAGGIANPHFAANKQVSVTLGGPLGGAISGGESGL